jgi:hypothetical protein
MLMTNRPRKRKKSGNYKYTDKILNRLTEAFKAIPEVDREFIRLAIEHDVKPPNCKFKRRGENTYVYYANSSEGISELYLAELRTLKRFLFSEPNATTQDEIHFEEPLSP